MNGTPHEHLMFGIALVPQSIAAAGTANGERIEDPAKYGEHLSILMSIKGGAGLSAFTARLEGSNDNGTTWAPVKKNDGVTDLAFTGADFILNGANDGKTVMGTIKPSRGGYKDYRLKVTTVTGGAVVVSASFIISPTLKRAVGVTYPGGMNAYGQTTATGGQVDHWLNDFLPTGS